MRLKIKSREFSWFLGSAIVVVIFLLPLLIGDYRETIVRVIESYPAFAPVIIIVSRIATTLFAPLPGLPVSVASLALLPWYQAWIYNLIGMEIGSIAAFLIARKFREPVVARLAPLQRIHEWQNQVSHGKQFLAFIGLRIISISAFDFVSYAAGLTTLSFRTFFLVSFLVDLASSFLFFYLGGFAIQFGIYLVLASVAILGFVMFLFKKRKS